MVTKIRGEADPFVAVPNWIWQNDEITHADLRVWIALKHFWNRRTGQCNPSHKSIADMSRVSHGGVRKALDHLVELGVIKVHADLKGGRRSNQYELVWSDSYSVAGGGERALLSSTRAPLSSAPGAPLSSYKQEEPEQEHAREPEPPHHYCRPRHKFIEHPKSMCDECVKTITPKEGIL